MSYDYQSSLSAESLRRYKEKLILAGLPACPYTLPANTWINDPHQWPDVQYGNIYNYLINFPSTFSKEAMENYKSLESYVFFVSGWVGEVTHVETSPGNLVMRADVTPSYRVTDDPHHPWIGVTKDGKVTCAHCDCMAGLGESCSHVGALLFKVEAAVRLGHTSLACTSGPCPWNESRVKNVDPAPIANIKFYTDEAKSKVKADHMQPHLPSTSGEQQQFLHQLASDDVTITGLSVFKDFSIPFVHNVAPCSPRKLPRSLRFLYKPQNADLTEDEIGAAREKWLIEQRISNVNIVYIQVVSKGQMSTAVWRDLRIGRITASTAHNLLHTSSTSPAASYIKKICSIPQELTVPAVAWGREKEDTAYELYKSLQTMHDNFSVDKSGFVICEKFQFLGASPDGVISCTCCDDGVLEIKCPFKHRDLKILTAAQQDKSFCLDADLKLKSTHSYFTQVQLQMYVCDVKYADFVVWTSVDIAITRVLRDDLFINAMLPKLEYIWKTSIFPELFTRRLENAQERHGSGKGETRASNTGVPVVYTRI